MSELGLTVSMILFISTKYDNSNQKLRFLRFWRGSSSMEWYFSEEDTQGSVLIDEENWDAYYLNDESQLSADWLQWGVSAGESLFCFGGERAHTESPREASTQDCSSAGCSNSYLLKCGFKSDQTDYQLQNLSQSSSAQMDDNFLYSSFENEIVLPEVIVDSKAASTDSISTKYYQLPDTNDIDLDNWATEYGLLCWSPENSAKLGGSTTSKVPSVLNQEQLNTSGEAGIITGEEISSTTAVIQDLEAAVRQLDLETRIYFRDVFYQLASNLTQRQPVNKGGTMTNEDPMGISRRAECRTEKSSSMGGAKAGVIDEVIAELLLDRTCSNLHRSLQWSSNHCRTSPIRCEYLHFQEN